MNCRCNCPDYRTHIRGVNIGSTPTQITYTERKWEKDMGAFKRLLNSGIKPGRLDGAYVMERSAKNEREVRLGRPLDSETHKAFDDAGI